MHFSKKREVIILMSHYLAKSYQYKTNNNTSPLKKWTNSFHFPQQEIVLLLPSLLSRLNPPVFFLLPEILTTELGSNGSIVNSFCILGNYFLIISFQISTKVFSTLSPVFALTSKNLKPSSSASFSPSAFYTSLFSSRSTLFPTKKITISSPEFSFIWLSHSETF